jgi:alpha-tubulin suppressor-like RCC1 family protein
VRDGAAWCWGDNHKGQLGDNSTVTRASPGRVQGLTHGVTSIATGNNRACAVVDQAVKCWGNNAFGGLGNGTTKDSLVPVDVQGISGPVIAVAAGGDQTCALLENGAVECWGENASGELGNGTSASSVVPVQVAGLTDGVTSLALGPGTCAVQWGHVWCWGGGRSSVPVPVQGLSGNVTAVTAGHSHFCALMEDTVQCWGKNLYYALGTESVDSLGQSSVPVVVNGISGGVTATGTGAYHGCAATNGGLQCWEWRG